MAVKRVDVVEIAKVFADSLEGVELDTMTVLAHDIIGLNCYRNTLIGSEVLQYIHEALQYVSSLKVKQNSFNWSMLMNRLEKLQQ